MKKNIKHAILFFCFAIASNKLYAQVFHEDFEVVDSVISSGNGYWAQNIRISAGGLACDSAVVPVGGQVDLTTIAFSTAGMNNVILEFDNIGRIDFFDGGIIEVSNDSGITWHQVFCPHVMNMTIQAIFCGQVPAFSSATYFTWDPGNAGTIAHDTMWRHETFNLTPFAFNKQYVMVRFSLKDYNTPGPSGYPGWYIDNIKVDESPFFASGFVYNDINANCVFDGADTTLPNILVTVDAPSFYWNFTPTDASGNFSVPIIDTSALNILSVYNSPYVINYASACPLTDTISIFPSTGHSIGLTFSGPDLATYNWGVPWCIGDTSIARLCFSSLTPYPITGELQVVFSSTLSPLLGLSTPPVTQISGDTLIWSLNTIPIYPSYYAYGNLHCVLLPVYIDTTVALTDTISYSQHLVSFNGDIDSTNNYLNYWHLACASYDPNHKTVSPPGSIHAGDKLTYTVEFENTGTAPAQRVYVLDTLDDAQLDLSTFQIEFLSHAGNVYLNQNVLLVSFNNINLAPASVNPGQSTGQFRYSVYSKQNLPTGNTINNNAAIYFDYNAPIITNITSTLIDNGLGIANAMQLNDIKVFPNPSHQKFYVHVDENKKTTFALTDIAGKAISFTKKQISNSVYEINVGKQATGIFILKMMSDGEVKFQKVVMN